MTTSGVQVAGMRTAGTVSGARAGSRASGGASFADMLSVGASSQKGASSASADVRRAPASGSPQEPAKNVQESKPSGTVQNGKDSPKISENNAAQEGKAEGMQKNAPREETAAQSQAAGDSEENKGLDVEFVKSLKLFREAARMLEAQKLGELKQAIMDSMQIDEDELEQLLEQLGVNMQSLLQPQMLQQFVVAAECNGDPMGLLTNETAMSDLRNLLDKAQEIRAELLESQQMLPEVPEEQNVQEIADVPQKTDAKADVPDFAQVLAGSEKQGGKVLETRENPLVKETAGKMPEAEPEKEETGFTFEVVGRSGESAPAKEETGGKDSGNHGRPAVGSMAEQFLNLVAEAAPTDEAEFAQLTRSEQVRAVADQILEKVRVVLSDKQTSMEISLTPESLGRVTLNLISRHGALTAHFTAQNQIAKEAIESQMVVLRENLENQGLKVEAIEVTVSNFDFTQNGGAAGSGGSQENRQQNRRSIRFDEAVNAENTMSEADLIAADLMEQNGNQVDYTA